MTDTNKTDVSDVLKKMDIQHESFIRAGRYNGREGCWFNSGEDETVKAEYAIIRAAVAAMIEREAALSRRVAELEAVLAAAKPVSIRLCGLMSGKLRDVDHADFIYLQDAIARAEARNG